jgi:hypothetical protein
MLVRWIVAVSGIALAAGAAPAAHAAQICRWVDDQGRTQMSDVVPEAYRAKATCVDSSRYEAAPQDRREAEQRAAAERARAASAAARTPPPAPAVALTAPAASAPPKKRPAETVTDRTDCATWWRLYDESGACFGPYRNVKGGIKPEAYERCNVIPSPEAKCGPRVSRVGSP